MSSAPHLVDLPSDDGRVRRLVFRLTETSTVPPYEQLRGQISVMVAVGLLEPGVRLPTIRDLADRLGLAPGTVARAYRELDHDGVVVSHGRRGTFVSDEPPESEPLQERRRRLVDAATAYVFEARQLGIGAEDAAAAVADAFAEPEAAPAASPETVDPRA